MLAVVVVKPDLLAVIILEVLLQQKMNVVYVVVMALQMVHVIVLVM